MYRVDTQQSMGEERSEVKYNKIVATTLSSNIQQEAAITNLVATIPK